jgi:hypothetical protein
MITNGYCTVAELKLKIGRNDDSLTLTTDKLELAINLASRMIDEVTGSFFYQTTLTSEKVDRFGMSESGIMLNYSIPSALNFPVPILGVSSLIDDGSTLVVNSDYYIYKADGKILKDGVFSSDFQGITVSGTIGYSTTPDYAKNWCLTIAEAISGLGIRTLFDDEGGISQIISRSIPKWCMDDMVAHQRVVVV